MRSTEKGRADEEVVDRGITEPAYSDVTESPDVAKSPGTPEAREDRAGRTEARRERTDARDQLFGGDEMTGFRQRWSDVQTAFVDDPRAAVQRADALVAETTQRLSSMFSQARHRLEEQWDRGDHVTTEDLRMALQRYRAFFDRLLQV